MEEMVEAGWSDAQADCRRVFEENSHPMWVVEALEVVDVNQAALLHYGYSRDEFLAMTIDDLSVEKPPAAKVAQDPRAVWKTSAEGRLVHRRGDDLVRGHLPRAAGLPGLHPRRHLPPADGGPDTLSRSVAGDGHRRRGRQRRQVHPHGVERRRRIDLRKTGRRGARTAGRAGVPHRLRRRRARRGDQAICSKRAAFTAS